MTECKENVITTCRFELFENVKSPITCLPIPYACHLGTMQISNIRLGSSIRRLLQSRFDLVNVFLAIVLRRSNRDTIAILKWRRNSLGVVSIVPHRFHKTLLWPPTITKRRVCFSARKVFSLPFIEVLPTYYTTLCFSKCPNFFLSPSTICVYIHTYTHTNPIV